MKGINTFTATTMLSLPLFAFIGHSAYLNMSHEAVVHCRTDKDCLAHDTMCVSAPQMNGGCAVGLKVCVRKSGLGESCGGNPLRKPCAYRRCREGLKCIRDLFRAEAVGVCKQPVLKPNAVCASGGPDTGFFLDRMDDCPTGTRCWPRVEHEGTVEPDWTCQQLGPRGQLAPATKFIPRVCDTDKDCAMWPQTMCIESESSTGCHQVKTCVQKSRKGESCGGHPALSCRLRYCRDGLKCISDELDPRVGGVCQLLKLKPGQRCQVGGPETGFLIDRTDDCPDGTACERTDAALIATEPDWVCRTDLSQAGGVAAADDASAEAKSCTSDADCAAIPNTMCVAEVGPTGCLETKVCTPRAGRGENCGGNTGLACGNRQCKAGLKCVQDQLHPAAQGVCKAPVLKEGAMCGSGGVDDNFLIDRMGDCPQGTRCVPMSASEWVCEAVRSDVVPVPIPQVIPRVCETDDDCKEWPETMCVVASSRTGCFETKRCTLRAKRGQSCGGRPALKCRYRECMSGLKCVGDQMNTALMGVCVQPVLKENAICYTGGPSTGYLIDRRDDCVEGTECVKQAHLPGDPVDSEDWRCKRMSQAAIPERLMRDDGVECKTDADCAGFEGMVCQQAQGGGQCLATRVCTKLADLGEACGGDEKFPCRVRRCKEQYKCIRDELNKAAPGVCNKPQLRKGDLCKEGGEGYLVDRSGDCPADTRCTELKSTRHGEVIWTCAAGAQ